MIVTQNLAIQLLKIALETSTETKLPRTLSEQEWNEIYSFAEQQTIIGVLFSGIEKLPKVQLPDMKLLMDWIGNVEYIRMQNGLLNCRCKELSAKYEAEGFKTCILKGQSNACLYPKDMTRIAGDVDILLTDPKAMNFNESRHNVIRHIWKSCPKCTVQYHHIEFPHVNDVSVEIHYTPVIAFGYFINRRLQKYLWEHREGEREDASGFNHLDREANLIFQMYHIFKHLMDTGVGLRQVVDYFWLLKSTRKDVRELATARLNEFGLRRFAGALMYVLQACCGLEDEYLLIVPDESRGRYFMKEIFKGGNFGRHDDRFDKKTDGKIHNFMLISRRAFRNFRYFPKESIQSPIGRAFSIFWLKRHGYYVEH